MTLRRWAGVLALITVLVALLNITILHDPELTGAIMLSVLVVGAAATYPERNEP